MTAFELDLGPLLPEHLSELVVGVVLLVIIWAVVVKVVAPRFEDTYERRTAVTRGAIEEAERQQAEAQAALARYNAQLAQAQDEAQAIRQQARDESVQIKQQAVERAEAEAARVATAARAQLEAERGKATTELRGEIGGLATVLAERILGEVLTDDQRASRAVDRFLADLDQQPARV
ncbi:MAG: F0F1 ATP synthase subunit B [Propionibacteriaceae bacterium]|nr:F0F1 ATP synthase subunit B [Propionibacteriaceae bacterium]